VDAVAEEAAVVAAAVADAVAVAAEAVMAMEGANGMHWPGSREPRLGERCK